MTSAGQWGLVLPSCADDGGAQSGGIAKSVASAMHYVRSVPRPQASSRALGNLTPQYIISKEEQRCWGIDIPCRQIGQELESSSNHGSTHA